MDELDTRTNPFPGLRSFEPDEDHLFFGRESRIDELLTRLRKSRFLSVVGTSGSGKSSLIRSGLIPSLYSGLMTRAGSSWRVALFRPGEDPIGNLAEALNSPEVLGPEDEELSDTNRALVEVTLRRSGNGLLDCLRQARVPEHENILVVVDQFEELFRFKHSRKLRETRDEAVAFVKLLLSAAHQDALPIYVVITMRSDFIGNCTEFEGLTEAINDGQYLVPRMTREERRSAIVGPVAVGGAEITPRLVLRLLNDVGDDPDQLPILQHALMRTWDYWESHHSEGEAIDLRHYEAIGTMKEALSQHAEEAFRELESAADRMIAERMFKALTDRGSDARGVRNPRRLEEICALTGAGEEEAARVVEIFRRPGRSFLMPPADTTLHLSSIIDISHESLMRIWTRLIQWVDEEARSAQIYLRISKAAARFQEGKGGLYRDPELQLALNWRDEAEPNTTWAERYDVAYERAMLFLEHSERQRDLEIAEKERQRRRQLQWARRLAMILGSAALISLLFFLFAMMKKIEADENFQAALTQKQIAEEQRQEADRQRGVAEEQRQEADSARETAEEQRQVALEQREIAVDERQRAEEERQRAEAQRRRAEEQEQEALRRKRQAEAAREQEAAARAEAVEQKERAEVLRVQAEDSEAETQRLRMLAVARELAIQTSRLAQEEQRQLAALLARQAFRLHMENGGDPADPDLFEALRSTLARLAPERVPVLRQHSDAVRCLAALPGGSRVISAGDDGTVYLTDLAARSPSPQLIGSAGSEIRGVVWISDSRVATGSLDGLIRLWDLASPGAPTLLEGHGAGVSALAFRQQGSILASAALDGEIRLWRLPETGSWVSLRPPGGGRIEALAFTADGRIIGAVRDNGLSVWDPTEPQETPLRLLPGRDIVSLAVSPAGLLAAGTRAGPILLLPPQLQGQVQELAGHASAVTSLSFDRDGGRLASASLDGNVHLWRMSSEGAAPIKLPGHSGWVWAVSFTADGRQLVSGGADRSLRLWPTLADPLAKAICEQASRNLTREEWSEFLPADIPWQPTCTGLASRDPA